MTTKKGAMNGAVHRYVQLWSRGYEDAENFWLEQAEEIDWNVEPTRALGREERTGDCFGLGRECERLG